MIYFGVLIIVENLYVSHHKKHATVIFYMAVTPIMFMGILLGTYLDPKEPAITFMVLMCVLTIFILDKPLKVVLYITFLAVTFGICCYNAKSRQLFMDDLIDLLVFYFIAVGVNFFTINDRIDNVENFMRYRLKSELDLLTGLYNRGAGVDKVSRRISQQRYGAFLMIDIDNFKYINDQYGHTTGDAFLKKAAETLQTAFKTDDIVFRIGGDEFSVFAEGLTDETICSDKFDQLISMTQKIRVKSAKECHINISIGCTIYDEYIDGFQTLYKMSDHALYKAKNAGKGCYFINKVQV